MWGGGGCRGGGEVQEEQSFSQEPFFYKKGGGRKNWKKKKGVNQGESMCPRKGGGIALKKEKRFCPPVKSRPQLGENPETGGALSQA